MESEARHLPALLARARAGDPDAAAALLPLVYEDLKRLAQWHMSREQALGAGHTLQATALVHEAYLRLSKGNEVPWQDRKHFFNAAALAMRRILVERARRMKLRPARASGDALELLPQRAGASPGPAMGAGAGEPDWSRLDSALTELERADPELAEVVHLRYFAGLSVGELGLALEVSARTINRRWEVARAWLLDWMAKNPSETR